MYNQCFCPLFSSVEKEEAPDYTPGIRQSGNAKISFNDNDYFKRVSVIFGLSFLVHETFQRRNCFTGELIFLLQQYSDLSSQTAPSTENLRYVEGEGQSPDNSINTSGDSFSRISTIFSLLSSFIIIYMYSYTCKVYELGYF